MADQKIEHHIRVDPTPEGILLIRFEKRFIDAQGNVTRQYHRTPVEPGMPLDAHMAMVNKDLARLGYEVPDAVTMDGIRAAVALVHTPERVAQFRADQATAESRFFGKKG